MKTKEEQEKEKEEQQSQEELWPELCELIRYHIFEGALDKEFLEEALKYFTLERKLD